MNPSAEETFEDQQLVVATLGEVADIIAKLRPIDQAEFFLWFVNENRSEVDQAIAAIDGRRPEDGAVQVE
jgi:ferritin